MEKKPKQQQKKNGKLFRGSIIYIYINWCAVWVAQFVCIKIL